MTRPTTWCAAVMGMALAGCGGGSPGAGPAYTTASGGAGGESMDAAGMGRGTPLTPEEEEAVREDHDTAMTLEGELDAAMLQAGGADCLRAATLRDRICELADRICAIADRHPDEGVVATQCEDGRSRCERAVRTVADRCGA